MQTFIPMSPILTDALPQGKEWGYQLKWDGFRILALVDGGSVELFSKKLVPQTEKYPELVQALSRLKGTYLFDGEAVILDPATGMPSFQKMQHRNQLSDRSLIRRASLRQPLHYIVFDLLLKDGQDLRGSSFRERHELLRNIDWGADSLCYTADLFEEEGPLWSWVSENGWEGVIGKRLSSPYGEGKDHKDWFKRKTVLHIDVEIVGFLMKAGKLSSLAMRKNGIYVGRVSLGLDEAAKKALLKMPADGSQSDYFDRMPEGLRGTEIQWLREPLSCRVTGLQITNDGLIRQPKLLWLEGIPL